MVPVAPVTRINLLPSFSLVFPGSGRPSLPTISPKFLFNKQLGFFPESKNRQYRLTSRIVGGEDFCGARTVPSDQPKRWIRHAPWKLGEGPTSPTSERSGRSWA